MEPEHSIKTWFLFAMAGLAGLLYGIDIGVITAALPYIRATTTFTDAQLSLVVGAVVMGAVGSALFAGPLADRLGRKPTIALSAAAFTLSVPVIWFLGWLGNQVGLSQAFWVVPACFAAMGAMLLFDRRFVFRR